MPKDYGSWPLASLKAELRKRNAKITGRKAVLVQRLLDYDVMFGGLVNDPDTSYRISVPKPELFFDINSSTVLPSITVADVQRYSILGERENLETSKNMYNENYLLTSRVAHSGNIFYVTGTCAAEMRKNVTYNITCKIELNTILEAQCECAAGMGPYAQCKHVLVLMYGLVDFTNTKTIKIRSSPTSNLQIFHHPTRIYTGEPILAKDLRLKKNYLNFNQITSFDPRTKIESKEKYSERFMNLTLNFSASQQISMPIQQLRKPANIMALHRDHDYLEKSPEQMFIERQILTDEQLLSLENVTRNEIKVWKQERQKRLHSSNFGKICKSTINKSKLAKSFLKNQGILTTATKHGIKYEKKAIEIVSEVTGHEIKNCGVFVHKEHQFLASTPDGILDDDGLVEVKCPYSAKYKKITSETVPYLYLCSKTGYYKLDENHDYYYQIQGQMMCTGRNFCYFAVYTVSDFYLIKIKRNNDFINEMLKKLILFYNDHYKHFFLCKYFYNIKI